MSNKKRKPLAEQQRNIALCYIRQSQTRDENDVNSPVRQRSNIEEVCKRNDWVPEWYEDASGHKSGRHEHNRPGWLALKSRLGDPDVVALVANDLSRLHRKGWRIGDLLDQLNELSIHLVLAAPGREVDTTTIKGRMFLQFGAIIDEYYAEDISQRAKDDIAYRKKLGKTIGRPPFGTIRNEEGYLIPSPEGAWLLPGGRFVAGTADEKPEENALWRGYHEVAEKILTLYASGEMGVEKIAYTLNLQGWAYRDRKGHPRTINREDIRRVVANWGEYGGLSFERKAKERPAYETYNVDDIQFREDRAIFPIELLKKVASLRQERTIKPKDRGIHKTAYPYALSHITYCARCDEIARQQNNPSARTTLGGYATKDGERRYRHKRGCNCGVTNRSVPSEVFEADFERLLSLLTANSDKIDLMMELAIQIDEAFGINAEEGDFETKRAEAIALCNRRIEAAIHLYGEGRISKEEYMRRVDQNEREITHWQSRTTETQKLALELVMCIDAIEKIRELWVNGDPEDRQGLARSLFTEIVYDLDVRRIVDFKLKPWAEQFLVLSGCLYEGGNPVEELTQEVHTNVPHTGLEPVFWP